MFLAEQAQQKWAEVLDHADLPAVPYTPLTLPTIFSVPISLSAVAATTPHVHTTPPHPPYYSPHPLINT